MARRAKAVKTEAEADAAAQQAAAAALSAPAVPNRLEPDKVYDVVVSRGFTLDGVRFSPEHEVQMTGALVEQWRGNIASAKRRG